MKVEANKKYPDIVKIGSTCGSGQSVDAVIMNKIAIEAINQ